MVGSDVMMNRPLRPYREGRQSEVSAQEGTVSLKTKVRANSDLAEFMFDSSSTTTRNKSFRSLQRRHYQGCHLLR